MLSPILTPVPPTGTGPATPAPTVSPIAERIRDHKSRIFDVVDLIRSIKSSIDL